MWRRRKSSNTDKKQANESAQTKDNEVCPRCIQLMQENSQLREELAILKGEGKKKEYTINPTLYTFYKNNVQKHRVSRYAHQYGMDDIQSSQSSYKWTFGRG